MRINNVEYYNQSTYTAGSKRNCADLYRVNHNKAFDSVSFGMRVDYGIPAKLPQELQNKVKNIHINIDFIQNFFVKYTRSNPQLGAKIKKEYADLIPKRQSGIVFKLPDTENTLEIMKSQTRENILYISINDNESEYNGIVIDGHDKLIANYLKKHPHMLPKGIKYMNAARMANAEPEKFITIADEKLQKYANYIKDLQTGVIPMPKLSAGQTEKVCHDKNEIITTLDNKTTKFLNRTSEKNSSNSKKITKLSNKSYEEYMTDKAKNIIKQITDLSNMDAKSLPDYITTRLTPTGKIISLKVKTDDGGTLIVTKKLVGAYGNSMPYLSFEKSNTDNTYNFISIDMVANKILRTKSKGKPHISNDNIVYHLTPEELRRRKTEEKLDYYMSQIFRKESDKKIITTENIVETPEKSGTAKTQVKIKTEESQGKSKTAESPKEKRTAGKTKKVQHKTQKENSPINTEKLIANIIEQGKKDGSIAATEYFNAFREQFIKDIQQKMTVFQENINKFIDTLKISDL